MQTGRQERSHCAGRRRLCWRRGSPIAAQQVVVAGSGSGAADAPPQANAGVGPMRRCNIDSWRAKPSVARRVCTTSWISLPAHVHGRRPVCVRSR